MSFGDPNNPYGQQPPQGQPGYGYPQQAPQGIPPQGGYAYPPQQAPMGYPAGPGGYSGAPATMPGLMMTARVLLFIVAGVQVLIGVFAMFGAATINDASNMASDSVGSNPFSTVASASAGVVFILALVFLGLSALSITLGVKFSRGGQGIRITTMVYGILGALVGVLALIGSASADSTAALIWALLWIGFGGTMAAAMIAPSGAAWFGRPRY
ncbi:hypothetical protein [Streptomyces sp. NPDC096339]|uniref:hypothetical protein n=1 Tax=Streptomyces sp. NPDC096339 TaxID=3366086 RepID=UPI003820661E